MGFQEHPLMPEMVPYGGPGKKHRKTARISSTNRPIAITLDRKWGMVQTPAPDGMPLFISLDDVHRGIANVGLYQMKGQVSPDQRSPRRSVAVKTLIGLRDPIFTDIPPRDDRIRIKLKGVSSQIEIPQ